MIFSDFDRVVFAGDSVTDMGSERPVGEGLFDNLGRSYVRVIENMLMAWYPKLNIRITNSGISGNTSKDLLERFDRDVVELNPQWVSICIGINDVWRQFDVPACRDYAVSVEEYEKNLETMILKIRGKVKGIFICTPYYIEPNKSDLMRNRMDEYIKVCKYLAQKYNCELVDFQGMYDEFCKYKHSSIIAWDRVHPNQMGATLMAKEFLKHCDFDFSR
ncbi:MAG: SGNH/GDSL hydrolase family protein [Clostridia bacterium]|nr:SGNH/GDSL hydrolase family protein [Clostridia bacterium]